MKPNRPLFAWGKFDKNDLLHAPLGLVFFLIAFGLVWVIESYTTFDLGLEPKNIGMIAIFIGSFVWEFIQNKRKGASIDVKDIAVSCFLPAIFCIVF